MQPSYGVPWPRLQRAAARFSELYAAPREANRVHALLFLCGLKYLLTYRQANGRRLSHYLDDGLREAVEHTLPFVMRRSKASARAPECKPRLLPRRANVHFEKLVAGFTDLPRRLPASTARWLVGSEANFLRLTFGMGVAARFGAESHQFTREMLAEPFDFPRPVLDVVESFHWHPEWSLALAR